MEANIQEWFRAFYATSDDGSAHQKYTTFFTQDATLIMGDQRAVGRAGMRLTGSSKNDAPMVFAFQVEKCNQG